MSKCLIGDLVSIIDDNIPKSVYIVTCYSSCDVLGLTPLENNEYTYSTKLVHQTRCEKHDESGYSVIGPVSVGLSFPSMPMFENVDNLMTSQNVDKLETNCRIMWNTQWKMNGMVPFVTSIAGKKKTSGMCLLAVTLCWKVKLYKTILRLRLVLSNFFTVNSMISKPCPWFHQYKNQIETSQSLVTDPYLVKSHLLRLSIKQKPLVANCENSHHVNNHNNNHHNNSNHHHNCNNTFGYEQDTLNMITWLETHPYSLSGQFAHTIQTIAKPDSVTLHSKTRKKPPLIQEEEKAANEKAMQGIFWNPNLSLLGLTKDIKDTRGGWLIGDSLVDRIRNICLHIRERLHLESQETFIVSSAENVIQIKSILDEYEISHRIYGQTEEEDERCECNLATQLVHVVPDNILEPILNIHKHLITTKWKRLVVENSNQLSPYNRELMRRSLQFKSIWFVSHLENEYNTDLFLDRASLGQIAPLNILESTYLDTNFSLNKDLLSMLQTLMITNTITHHHDQIYDGKRLITMVHPHIQIQAVPWQTMEEYTAYQIRWIEFIKQFIESDWTLKIHVKKQAAAGFKKRALNMLKKLSKICSYGRCKVNLDPEYRNDLWCSIQERLVYKQPDGSAYCIAKKESVRCKPSLSSFSFSSSSSSSSHMIQNNGIQEDIDSHSDRNSETDTPRRGSCLKRRRTGRTEKKNHKNHNPNDNNNNNHNNNNTCLDANTNSTSSHSVASSSSMLLETEKEIEPQCSICLGPYMLPLQTSCGHVFCKACINDYFTFSSGQAKCPECRSMLTKTDLCIPLWKPHVDNTTTITREKKQTVQIYSKLNFISNYIQTSAFFRDSHHTTIITIVSEHISSLNALYSILTNHGINPLRTRVLYHLSALERQTCSGNDYFSTSDLLKQELQMIWNRIYKTKYMDSHHHRGEEEEEEEETKKETIAPHSSWIILTTKEQAIQTNILRMTDYALFIEMPLYELPNLLCYNKMCRVTQDMSIGSQTHPQKQTQKQKQPKDCDAEWNSMQLECTKSQVKSKATCIYFKMEHSFEDENLCVRSMLDISNKTPHEYADIFHVRNIPWSTFSNVFEHSKETIQNIHSLVQEALKTNHIRPKHQADPLCPVTDTSVSKKSRKKQKLK